MLERDSGPLRPKEINDTGLLTDDQKASTSSQYSTP